MQDRYHFQLDVLLFTIVLLFFFCIVSAGFLIGVLVGTVSLPAEIVTGFAFLAVALLILALGVALTAFLYGSIRVLPQQPVQTLRRILFTHTIKRSSRMARAKLS